MGAFTRTYQSRIEAIVTECKIYPGVPVAEVKSATQVARALWDTGATQTMISSSVVESLQLEPIGQCEVEGFHGVELENLYHIHIGLPTGEAVLDIDATVFEGSYDVVIGMDVISRGDLAFTNKDGQSMFSFRIPSKEHIDLK